jgi:elongation factor G
MLELVRNIGVIAHIDAGKTTVTERMLLASGRIRKAGEVHDGTATTDFDPQERKRGITINAAAVSIAWRDQHINLIDTPGHVDFTVEVERSLRVLDGGVVVFDAVAGVEPQTETVWRQADTYGVPRICFVNKMDRLGANFVRTVRMIRERLGARAVPLHYPLGSDQDFVGVIDLLSGATLNFGAAETALSVPAPAAAEAAQWREALIEAIVEHDEALLASYLEGQPLEETALRQALRRATIAGRLVPVLCGAALKNKGIAPLLDAVLDYLPTPREVPAVVGQAPGAADAAGLRCSPDPAAPLAALVFKVVSDEHVGQLAYARIYAGTLVAGSYVLNSTRQGRERVSRILQVQANQYASLERASAGDIVALVGTRQSSTGDTLCDPAHPVVLEQIQFPEPVVTLAVEARSSADRDRLGLALQKLASEDPTFRVGSDPETGQTIVAGMGELHLEVRLEQLRLTHKLDVRQGRPQVAYRETICRAAEVEQTLARQSGGGSGQWARVRLRLEPLARGEGFRFSDTIVGGAIPRPFIAAVEAGVREALGSGVLAGYPVVDLHVTLLGGATHAVDSSDLAFQVAASMAFKEAMAQAQPQLLEPLMRVEVVTPDDYVGAVLGDLGGRRGQVLGMESHGSTQLLRAQVPLAELFGYSARLRSFSQGRASFSMQFASYSTLPDQLASSVATRRVRG